MADEIRFVGEMQRLSLKAGDVLVLHSHVDMSQQHMVEFEQYVATAFPGTKVLVMTKGTRLGVISALEA